MRRISSQMANNDVQQNLRIQESRLNKANNQMGSQQRIQQLRDDPIAAGHLVRYQSYQARVEQFEKNAKTLSDQFSVTEGYVNQTLQIMHRVRELAVTGANGLFTQSDLSNMAGEVNELLQEMVANANATGPDGLALFSGTRSSVTAFDTVMGNVNGAGEPVITGIRYNGSIDENNIEIDEHKYMNINRAGNQVFWAEQQQIFSLRDATGYQVASDTAINVDGVNIRLNAGDNVYAVISKINDSGAAVKASLDLVSKGLNLTTTDSRQLWLQDIDGGTTLRDLGILHEIDQRPPNNINPAARVSGGSIFDTVIALRDSMLSGDNETIGGKVLSSLDSALNNLTAHLADIGSRYERAQVAISRNSEQNLNVTGMIAREGDLDFTKAITDLKMLEYTQQATLSTAAKLYSNNLLNYMR